MTARLRRWRRNPLLTVHYLVTIGLGMAAATAVASLMVAIAFQPLPFRDSAQLVQVWHRVEGGAPIQGFSGNDLAEVHEGAGAMFSSFGGYLGILLWAREEGKSTGPLSSVRMEPTAFRALDVRPIIGPPVDESTADGGRAVWLGHSFWQSHYGGRPSVVGETIRLAWNDRGQNETQAYIAGVMPPGLRIPSPASTADREIDVWSVLPDEIKANFARNRSLQVLGRLTQGRTAEEAQAALTVLADRRAQATGRRHRPVVQSFAEVASGPTRRTIGMLALGVALVVLLAFANLASLTVADGSRRRLELSVRIALGATRWQLWRDLVAEHLVVTVCALGLGVPLAWLALRGLTRLLVSADIGPAVAASPALNIYAMLGFTVCALVATLVWSTLIVGRLTSSQPGGQRNLGELSGAARLSTPDSRATILRLLTLSVQACLGIALMVLAVSMARVYVRLTTANLGPAPDRTTFFSIRPMYGGTPTSEQAANMMFEVRALLQSLPGVEAVAVADNFPPRGSAISFYKPGDPADAPRPGTYPISVSHDYFTTLGIPILFGRSFDDSDRLGGKAVAVIDAEMARRNWPAPKDALNMHIKIGAGSYEVIGVAGSFEGYWWQQPTPTLYLSQNQEPRTSNVVILRTGSTSPGISERARQIFSRLPIQIEMSTPTTLQAGWQATATRPWARMIGMLLLALIGVGLGAQGVYALAASIAAARQQELAIRTALGASPTAVIWLVLRQIIAAVAAGSGLGVLGVLAVQRLAPQWISVALTDPATPIALALTVLLSTAVCGGFLPVLSTTRATSAAWLRR